MLCMFSQPLSWYAHDDDDFSITLLSRGLRRPKSGTGRGGGGGGGVPTLFLQACVRRLTNECRLEEDTDTWDFPLFKQKSERGTFLMWSPPRLKVGGRVPRSPPIYAHGQTYTIILLKQHLKKHHRLQPEKLLTNVFRIDSGCSKEMVKKLCENHSSRYHTSE